MSALLKKPKDRNQENILARYEPLNLKDNPFPLNPYVNKDNADIRYNGSIYESKIRETEYNQVIQNFIKVPQSNPNHIRMGYIQDNSYVGRGNGKSAFALNLVHIINQDFCMDISDDLNKCFGIHIQPEPSGRTKTFDSFVDLVFQAILDQNLIEYSLASLRLDAITKLIQGFNVETEFKDEYEIISSLNSESWFDSCTHFNDKLSLARITKQIYQDGNFTKISADFPLNRDLNKFYNYRITKQDDFQKYYFETLKKSNEKAKFIFNDLVLLFRASGFNGGYIIVDDFERIPDFQSEKLKQEFALEIRTNFFDSAIENAKIGFLNLILVMHAGVPRLVEKAWSISGMERRSPLISDAANQPHVIKFDKLNLSHSKLLIQKYIAEYRINTSSSDDLSPFTDEAIALISERCELNAASMLEKCYALIEEAVNSNKTSIDDTFVKEFFGKNIHIPEDESEDVSVEDSVDLFAKAKKKQ